MFILNLPETMSASFGPTVCMLPILTVGTRGRNTSQTLTTKQRDTHALISGEIEKLTQKHIPPDASHAAILFEHMMAHALHQPENIKIT